MLTTGETYRDLGRDYFTYRETERLSKRLIRQFQPLALTVILQPANRTPA